MIDKWFCLNNTRLWIKGGIKEGDSILQLEYEYTDNLNTPHLHKNDIRDTIFLHRHFFLISVAKVREYLVELSKVDSDLKEILNVLDEKFPDIRDLRNMNEHDISYYNEKGHKQKSFFKTNENISYTDATSVEINKEGYLIGGRLNLQFVIDYLIQIYPKIEKKLCENEAD